MNKFPALLAAGVAAALAVGIGGGGAGAAAVPSARPATGSAAFSGLSCKGGAFCLATGIYHKTGARDVQLLEAWNGRTWHTFPKPRYYDNDIMCGAATFCLAGTVPPKQAERWVEWNGRTWQSFKPQPPSSAWLTCPAAKFCVTVTGSNQTVDGSLAESWTGGTSWQAMPGWFQSQCEGPWCGISQLSCATASICSDSGTYCTDDNCDSYVDFEGIWNGATWDSPPPNGTLLGQVCAGRSFCMTLTLTPTLSAKITRDWGNSWHHASAGLAAACHRAGCAQLHAIACGSSYSCVALTSKSQTGPAADALIWNGITWKTVPIARAGGRLPSLTLLSCGGPHSCAAIGTYSPAGTSRSQPIAEHWNGSTWKITPIPTTP